MMKLTLLVLCWRVSKCSQLFPLQMQDNNNFNDKVLWTDFVVVVLSLQHMVQVQTRWRFLKPPPPRHLLRYFFFRALQLEASLEHTSPQLSPGEEYAGSTWNLVSTCSNIGTKFSTETGDINLGYRTCHHLQRTSCRKRHSFPFTCSTVSSMIHPRIKPFFILMFGHWRERWNATWTLSIASSHFFLFSYITSCLVYFLYPT